MPDQDNVDLSFLEKKQVELICFAAYSVYLHFPDKVLLSIEGPFQHQLHGNANATPKTEFPLSSSDLVSLLTRSIEKINRDSDGTLRLSFSNGNTLTIEGDGSAYQAYEITVDGAPVASSSTVGDWKATE